MDERSLLLMLGLFLGVLVAAQIGALMAQRRVAMQQIAMQERLDGRIDKLSQKLAEYQQSNIRMGEEVLALREKLNQQDDKHQRLQQQARHTKRDNHDTRNE